MPNRIIRDIMTPCITGTGDLSISAGAELMRHHQVGALLIVDTEAKLIGIITERDVLYKVVAEGADPRHTLIRDVMTLGPVTVSPHKRFVHAMHLMKDCGFRHVPVVDGSELVGMLSLRDALSGDWKEFEQDEERKEDIAQILG